MEFSVGRSAMVGIQAYPLLAKTATIVFREKQDDVVRSGLGI